MRHIILITIALFISLNASAGNFTGTISAIQYDWYGQGYVFTLSGTNNGCPTSSGYVVLSSFSGYKEAVATIMLAYSQQKGVIVTTNTGTPCIPSVNNGVGNVLGILVP